MVRRAGFTLVETLLVVTVVGILTLMAYPRVNSAIVRSDLRGARTRVVNMLATARTVAMQGSRTGRLEFNGNMAFVTTSPRKVILAGSDRDTVGSVVNLNTVYGTTAALSTGTAIAFDPRGLATGLGAGVTITLSRSSHTQTVTVDMLGRVRK